jgi:deazaflavin-dependent oxidoreductase (nitroreductase family)
MTGPQISEQFCYLTTTGRVTGKPHAIEIWFAGEAGSSTIYMLAGGGYGADWVKNIVANPHVHVRIGVVVFDGRGRIIREGEEEGLARRLVVAKYYGRDVAQSSGWEAEALPVAIDLEATGS